MVISVYSLFWVKCFIKILMFLLTSYFFLLNLLIPQRLHPLVVGFQPYTYLNASSGFLVAAFQLCQPFSPLIPLKGTLELRLSFCA